MSTTRSRPRSRTAIVGAAIMCSAALLGCSQDTDSAPTTTVEATASSSTTTTTVPDGTPVSTYDDWAWFKDTYWIVPEEGIYSVMHSPSDPGTFTVVRGQTVFHLTDYFNGFFSGSVVAALTEELSTSCQYVLGEVTPEGAVYLTMFDAEDGTITNQPVGEMVEVDGEWTMVNTMTGPAPQGSSVSHWAYMVLAEPGDPTFEELPFAEESIPDFTADCPPGPAIDRTPGGGAR
jgi:hypothetical protein